MSRRHDRKPRWWRLELLKSVWSALSFVRADPKPYAFLGVLSLFLCWVVITKSLPYALAPSFPDSALSLNPGNPAALMVKAEQVRRQLLDLAAAPEGPESKGTAAPARPDTIGRFPEADSGSLAPTSGKRDALRLEIRRLANRTIAADPLNAQGYRLLAETAATQDQVRLLMEEAAKRSRRESMAQFWLFNDSVYHKNFRAAIGHADILLRTRPELSDYVMGSLARIADDPEGRPFLIRKLAEAPSWRSSFLAVLPQKAKQPDTPFKIMMALKASAKPVVSKELVSYLNALIAKNLVDQAYNIWLQFPPAAEHDNPGLITHANFEHQPTGLPFDWQVPHGVNAIAEFVALGLDEHALHVAFGPGRAQFPEIKQIIVLPYGRYHLEGKLRGSIMGKRGLRWQLRCASGAKMVLGQTDMLMGQSYQWRVFSFEAEVPATEDCRGQTLRVFHDSRSASEELLSGEAWFTGLHLERVSEPLLASH